MTDILYTFEYGGKRFDLERSTAREVEVFADDWYAENCPAMPDGTTSTDVGYIIRYSIDDEGNEVELHREEYQLEHHHYHGDLIEHRTY